MTDQCGQKVTRSNSVVPKYCALGTPGARLLLHQEKGCARRAGKAGESGCLPSSLPLPLHQPKAGCAMLSVRAGSWCLDATGKGGTDRESVMVPGHREFAWSSPLAGFSIIAQSTDKTQGQFGPYALCRLLASQLQPAAKSTAVDGSHGLWMGGIFPRVCVWNRVLRWSKAAHGTWESDLVSV